jgi:hypothetical protein
MRAESARSAPRARRAGKKGSRVGDRSFSKSVTIRTGQFSTRGTGHSSRCPRACRQLARPSHSAGFVGSRATFESGTIPSRKFRILPSLSIPKASSE